MTRNDNTNPVISEEDLVRGLIIDSRDLFSREKYEDRLEMELAVHIRQFQKENTVDANQLRTDVVRFIVQVEIIFRELEDSKRKAELLEKRKMDDIRALLDKGLDTSSETLREELENFANTLRSSNVRALRYTRRREMRLRRHKAPFGFVLKKLSQNEYYDAEVEKKAFQIGEHTKKEHIIFSEMDYLISMLNKNPNQETLDQLKDRIHRLTKDYEGDLDDFLTIEIDREIDEARKLHRIDHYITFLKMVKNHGNFDVLINRLERLKRKVDFWVYQDSADSRKLLRYAKAIDYGKRIDESSKKTNFSDQITTEKVIIDGVVHAILIRDTDPKKSKPNRGVVLAHGFSKDKENLMTLGKRIVSQNYWVVSIDLPMHGGSRAKLRLGLLSEYILRAVKWLRQQGIKNVGAVGHSTGSMGILFAMAGYNSKIEKEFYKHTTKLIRSMKSISKYLNKKAGKGQRTKIEEKNLKKALYHGILISKEYRKLKRIVLSGIVSMYGGKSDLIDKKLIVDYGGRCTINAAALLSTIKTIQYAMPRYQSFLVAYPFKYIGLSRFLLWSYNTQTANKAIEEMEGKNSRKFERTTKWYQTQLHSLHIRDVRDSFSYLMNVKNPFDYMNLINQFCKDIKDPYKESIQDEENYTFFRYYRNMIKKIPKLYVYGLFDYYINPFEKNNMEEIEQHYKDFGQTDIMRLPNASHNLNREVSSFERRAVDEASYESAQYPKMTYKIITFLNGYLGAGGMPVFVRKPSGLFNPAKFPGRYEQLIRRDAIRNRSKSARLR